MAKLSALEEARQTFAKGANKIRSFIRNITDPPPIIIYNKNYQKPVDEVLPATVTQTPQQNAPISSITADLIRRAIGIYGGQKAPLADYADVIANNMGNYDFWKNNPYLLPVLGHLETSSGMNVTRPNNYLNWGINYPGNNAIFQTMTPEQVLERAISGIGERSPYYSRFRTGSPMTDQEIMDFGRVYEPANPAYPQNLLNGIRFIESQLNQ